MKKCKFASHWNESVPMPFGSGNCSMPCFECTYEGDIELPEDLVCNEDEKCPAFSELPDDNRDNYEPIEVQP